MEFRADILPPNHRAEQPAIAPPLFFYDKSWNANIGSKCAAYLHSK